MNISLKNASFKLKWKVATLIMETEMQKKKKTFRKTEVEKGIKTDMQYTEKKFELGCFECSISSTKHSLEK